MKILYSVQSTGLGHLTPYLSLGTALAGRGHEVITVTSGPGMPSFLSPVGERHYHFIGPTLIVDSRRLSFSRTTIHNLVRLPVFVRNLVRLRRLIREEKPDLILEDYEPYTSLFLRFFKTPVPSFSVDHQSLFVSDFFPHKGVEFLLRLITHIFTYARFRLCAGFVPYRSADGFVAVPPILQSEVLSTPVSDDGSIVVYHSSVASGAQEKLKKECPQDRRMIFYGYEAEEYGSLVFKPKGGQFLRDLSRCHAFVTNCGFVSVCEALVLGKKIICQPLAGHYEQEWNARMLKAFKNVRVVDEINYSDLGIEHIPPADPAQTVWLREGLSTVLDEMKKRVPEL